MAFNKSHLDVAYAWLPESNLWPSKFFPGQGPLPPSHLWRRPCGSGSRSRRRPFLSRLSL